MEILLASQQDKNKSSQPRETTSSPTSPSHDLLLAKISTTLASFIARENDFQEDRNRNAYFWEYVGADYEDDVWIQDDFGNCFVGRKEIEGLFDRMAATWTFHTALANNNRIDLYPSEFAEGRHVVHYTLDWERTELATGRKVMTKTWIEAVFDDQGKIYSMASTCADPATHLYLSSLAPYQPPKHTHPHLIELFNTLNTCFATQDLTKLSFLFSDAPKVTLINHHSSDHLPRGKNAIISRFSFLMQLGLKGIELLSPIYTPTPTKAFAKIAMDFSDADPSTGLHGKSPECILGVHTDERGKITRLWRTENPGIFEWSRKLAEAGKEMMRRLETRTDAEKKLAEKLAKVTQEYIEQSNANKRKRRNDWFWKFVKDEETFVGEDDFGYCLIGRKELGVLFDELDSIWTYSIESVGPLTIHLGVAPGLNFVHGHTRQTRYDKQGKSVATTIQWFEVILDNDAKWIRLVVSSADDSTRSFLRSVPGFGFHAPQLDNPARIFRECNGYQQAGDLEGLVGMFDEDEFEFVDPSGVIYRNRDKVKSSFGLVMAAGIHGFKPVSDIHTPSDSQAWAVVRFSSNKGDLPLGISECGLDCTPFEEAVRWTWSLIVGDFPRQPNHCADLPECIFGIHINPLNGKIKRCWITSLSMEYFYAFIRLSEDVKKLAADQARQTEGAGKKIEGKAVVGEGKESVAALGA